LTYQECVKYHAFFSSSIEEWRDEDFKRDKEFIIEELESWVPLYEGENRI